VHFVEREGRVLLFGLEWFPVLGGNEETQGRALARVRRASHHVLSAGDAASIGLLQTSGRLSRTHCYCSAAAAFAALYPQGTVAAALPMPGGGHWLVAVHEGAVMSRADQVLPDTASVHDTVQALQQAYPGLVAMTHETDLPDDLFERLFAAAKGRAELTRTRAFPVSNALIWSLPLVAAAVYAYLSLFADPASDGSGGTVDVMQLWQDAMANAVATHTLHGVSGTRTLIDAVLDLPLTLAGWQLRELECTSGAVEWRCRAHYRRVNDADNQGFVSIAPAHWQLAFDPMDGVSATWRLDVPAQSLGSVALRTSRQNDVLLFSALQAMVPAFSELRFDVPLALPVQAPLGADNHPVPRPPGLVAYQSRNVRVDAPLRSLSLLLPEVGHMRWERLRFQVSSTDQPSLRSSGLRMQLSGVLYEIDDAHAFRQPASGISAVHNTGINRLVDVAATDRARAHEAGK